MKKSILSLIAILLFAAMSYANTALEPIKNYAKNQPQPVTAYQVADAFAEMLANDPTYGTPVTFFANVPAAVRVTALDADKFVAMYYTSSSASLIVGEIASDNSISFGSPAAFSTGLAQIINLDAMTADKVAFTYRSGSSPGFVQVATISGTTITYGTAVVFDNNSIVDIDLAAFSDAVVVSYTSDGEGRGTAKSFAVSGTTLTEVSDVIYNYASTGFPSITKLGTENFVIAYGDGGNDFFGTVVNGTIDPSTGEILRLGNEVVFDAQQMNRTRIEPIDGSRFLIAYHLGAVLFTDNPINVVVGEINTTKTQILQMGTPVNAASPDTDGFAITVTDAATFVLHYSEPTDPTGDVIALAGDISGTAITGFSNPVTVLTDQQIVNNSFDIDMATVGDKFVTVFENQNDGTGATGDVILGTLDGTALPIVMNDFEAEATAEGVQLTWQTAAEQNNEGFDIQRKASNGSWENIGFAEGRGTTQATNNYEFLDENPLRGVNYYRLRQRDFDGRSEISAIVSVDFSMNEEVPVLQLFPNPVTDGVLNLDFSNLENEEMTIRIFTASGQLVSEFQQNENTLNVADLPNGAYFLEVQTGSETVSRQFVKE